MVRKRQLTQEDRQTIITFKCSLYFREIAKKTTWQHMETLTRTGPVDPKPEQNQTTSATQELSEQYLYSTV